MSDFPYAYKKVFIANYFLTSGKTENLQKGYFGFFDARTWEAVPILEANKTDHPTVVFAAGSFHTKDKVGEHGGYKESMKSQIIKPHQIHRFWKVAGRPARAQVVKLGWDGTNASTAPKFMCGKDYTLRIDLRGTPVLRILGLNAFRQYSVNTGCCADATDPQAVDPVAVMVEFAKLINSDPIFSGFIYPEVITADGPDFGTEPDLINLATYVPLTDPSAINAALATLQLTVFINSEGEFDDCSFDPREDLAHDPFYLSTDPPKIIAAQWVEDTSSACPDFKQLVFTEIQSTRPAEGNGRKILQELILSVSYKQDIYPLDPRRKEVENLDALHSYVSRTAYYDNYYILHSVDRKNNPSGVHNQDYYLLQISAPTNIGMSEFVNWMNSFMASATPGMSMEDLSDP